MAEESNYILVLFCCIKDLKMFYWCLREAGRLNNIIIYGCLDKSDEQFILENFIGFKTVQSKHSFSDRSQSGCVNDIIMLSQKFHVQAIIPTGFDSLKYLSYYRESLNDIKVIPLPDYNTINTLDNKVLFYIYCIDNALPHAKSIIANAVKPVDMSTLSFPVYVKLPFSSSGSGNIRCINMDDLCNALRDNSGDMLIQEIIKGYDIAFNGFALNGKLIAWTVQKFIEPFSGMRWSQFVENRGIYEISEKLIRIADYSGPINIDFRVDSTDGQIYLLEVNPRFWANTHYSIIDNVNFVDAAVQSIYEKKFRLNPKFSYGICGSPHKLPLLLMRKAISLKECFYYLRNQSSYQLCWRLIDACFSMKPNALSRLVKISLRYGLKDAFARIFFKKRDKNETAECTEVII